MPPSRRDLSRPGLGALFWLRFTLRAIAGLIIVAGSLGGLAFLAMLASQAR